ncbi:DNA-binding response regulator [Chakrabartia godavariana]|nr:DNA-binding response regulator [Chakrabartia godavariana]
MPEPTPLRTLIADDEPLAVERIQLLCSEVPGLVLVGTASDGGAAIRLAQALCPDLILLDIAMPDGDGISVARRIAEDWDKAKGPPPAIIFVTAFDGFAVEAFDLSAVDYLLKPVSTERLARAIERVRERRAIYAAPSQPRTDYVKEFWVPNRSEMVRVAASDIERIDAERDYVRLHCGGRNYLLHHTMTGLDTRLDPEMFIRLHRSVIVRRDRIRSLGHDRAGAWHAELADGETVRIGRTYLQAAKDMLRR